MNRPSENASLSAFLGVVERDRDERCRQILEEAKRKAREIEATARRDAHQRVTQAVRDARARSRAELEAARAALGTEERRLGYDVRKTLLERAWVRLEQVIELRWVLAETRRPWVLALIERARASLPACAWRVDHPSDLDSAELRDISERVRVASSAAPSMSSDSGVVHGIRIEASGACLDGTLHGLLANRTVVEGRLLMELASDVGGAP